MDAFVDLSALRQQLVDQNKRTAGLTGGVFAWPAEEIEKL